MNKFFSAGNGVAMHRKGIAFLAIFVFLTLLSASAQQAKVVSIPSRAMNKEINNTIILPENYDEKGTKVYPVVYLLHGYGNNYSSWLQDIKPNLPQLATEKEVIFVCPDGGVSWYWDSPINPDSQYETYVSKELTEYVDSHYRTVKSPKGRAITGYSMGGHGGLWLGIRHPDIFGACGSMSGGVDIRPFPNNWDMATQLGAYCDNPQVWDAYTVIDQIYRIKPDELEIIIDCGTNDFFFDVNEALHEKLLYNNIKHDYLTRPGYHNHEYWNNAIDYQLLFFEKFFDRGNK